MDPRGRGLLLNRLYEGREAVAPFGLQITMDLERDRSGTCYGIRGC